MKKNQRLREDILIGITGIIIILLIIYTNNQPKFNIYEKQFSNYTIQEDQEGHSLFYYNQSIEFTLAPIEDYSVSSIVNLIPLNKLNPICKKNSEEYRNRFCYSYSGGQRCDSPEQILDAQKSAGCFNLIPTQKIVSYFVINNSEIRQIGDTLKNLDTIKQNIIIIAEIENNTLYYTKVDVIKTNETDNLISGNTTKGKFSLFDLDKNFLNTNATCISSVCPEGYNSRYYYRYPGGDCYKCGSYCDFFGLDDKTKDKICVKWFYQDKYIIEEVK